MTVRDVARRLGLGRLRNWLFAGPRAGQIRAQRYYRRIHLISLRGRGFGAGGWRESGEAALLERLGHEHPDIRVIFDVGANVGGWSREVARIWPDATIYAFEPSRTTFAEYVEATTGLNVRPVHAALGDCRDLVTLHAVPGESALSSLYERDLIVQGLKMTEVETVDQITLDSYCEDAGIEHIDLLKIDAEGHDLMVLRGAQGLIDSGRIDLIQFEFGGANIDSRTFLRDFVRLLEPRYRISRLVTDGLEPLDYTELEEIFTTANFLAQRVDPAR
jgi:FkbM family methyltransferase